MKKLKKELTTGKTAVTIEVDGEEDADSRTVSFTGGTAYGEGLYDGEERPTVGAEASDGYEIDYFYGDRQLNQKGTIIQQWKFRIISSLSKWRGPPFQVQVQGKETHFDPDCQSDLRRNCYRRGNIQSKNQYPHHRCCKIRIHIFRMDCN